MTHISFYNGVKMRVRRNSDGKEKDVDTYSPDGKKQLQDFVR